MPARAIVKAAVEDRLNVHPSGEIVRLKEYTLWKGHLLGFEKEMKLNPTVKYVLYPDENAAGWRVQAVSEGQFDSRVPLHVDWRGVRDADLSKVAGIPGCVFVHATGFIGGNQTFEGALQMAIQSLANRPPPPPPQTEESKSESSSSSSSSSTSSSSLTSTPTKSSNHVAPEPQGESVTKKARIDTA